MIKCLNPYCQNKNEYTEYQCYCSVCGYSQAAGGLVREVQKDDLSFCGDIFYSKDEPSWKSFKSKVLSDAKKYAKETSLARNK